MLARIAKQYLMVQDIVVIFLVSIEKSLAISVLFDLSVLGFP